MSNMRRRGRGEGGALITVLIACHIKKQTDRGLGGVLTRFDSEGLSKSFSPYFFPSKYPVEGMKGPCRTENSSFADGKGYMILCFAKGGYSGSF